MANHSIHFGNFLLLSILSISSVCLPLSQKRQCSIAKLEECLEPMSRVTDDSVLAFPVTNNQLEVTCRLFQKGDQCIEDYVKQCTNQEINNMVWEMIQGAKSVLQHLCKPSSVQFSYLLYADCFKRIAIGPCHRVIEQFKNTSHEFALAKLSMTTKKTTENRTENKIMEKHLRYFCCSYKSSIDCQLEYVQDDCGVEAKEFFAYYMKEISKQVLTEHCLGYTYSDRCNQTQMQSLKTFQNIDNSVDSLEKFNSGAKQHCFLVVVCLLMFVIIYFPA